jgi:hypothetical protein
MTNSTAEILAWALFGIVLCVAWLLLRREGRQNSGVMLAIMVMIFIWTIVVPALWLAEGMMQ